MKRSSQIRGRSQSTENVERNIYYCRCWLRSRIINIYVYWEERKARKEGRVDGRDSRTRGRRVLFFSLSLFFSSFLVLQTLALRSGNFVELFMRSCVYVFFMAVVFVMLIPECECGSNRCRPTRDATLAEIFYSGAFFQQIRVFRMYYCYENIRPIYRNSRNITVAKMISATRSLSFNVNSIVQRIGPRKIGRIVSREFAT